jgi:CheY-like chemotaxis protein
VARVVLVHWNAASAEEHAARLRDSGHDVALLTPRTQADVRPLFEAPPDLFLIDLDRRPSEGRAIALWLRQRKATRQVPIVLAGGAAAKVEPVRALLPDATFVSWASAPSAVAAARAPERPLVPGTMAAYAGKGLVEKLGIRTGCSVALLGAPTGFEAMLAPLPEGGRLTRRGPAHVVLLFVTSRAELERRLAAATDRVAEGGSLWIAWPKRASGVASDLTQPLVRAVGMASGLVDFKVAAIDDTWSGLRFARRTR